MMIWEIGVDEAGRGPLIGPLVYGCVAIQAPLIPEILEKSFIRDSKSLSDKKRAEAYFWLDTNKHRIFAETSILPPSVIDPYVERKGLNVLSYETTVSLVINALRYIYKQKHPVTAINLRLDTLSSNPIEYGSKYQSCSEINAVIQKHFPETKWKAEAYVKGDSLHKVISAASIMAKETREREMLSIQSSYGDIGSGYPSDKKTMMWVESNFEVAGQICRRSWAPWKKIEARVRRVG